MCLPRPSMWSQQPNSGMCEWLHAPKRFTGLRVRVQWLLTLARVARSSPERIVGAGSAVVMELDLCYDIDPQHVRAPPMTNGRVAWCAPLRAPVTGRRSTSRPQVRSASGEAATTALYIKTLGVRAEEVPPHDGDQLH